MILAATAVVVGASPAAAAAPPSKALTGDVRCMLTMVALGGAKGQQQAAQVGADFFAGRISAHSTAAAMTRVIRTQAPMMKPDDFRAEFKRCGPIVAAYTGALQSGLASLRQVGQPTPVAPPPAPPIVSAPHP